MLSALNTAASAAETTPTQKPSVHARCGMPPTTSATPGNHQDAEQKIMSFEARARDRGLDERRDRRRQRHAWWRPPKRSRVSPSRRTPASGAPPRSRCRRRSASVAAGSAAARATRAGSRPAPRVTNNMRHHTSCERRQRDQLAEDGGEAPQHHADVHLDERAAMGVHGCTLLDRPRRRWARVSLAP